jgi:hypothetical protein
MDMIFAQSHIATIIAHAYYHVIFLENYNYTKVNETIQYIEKN